MKKVKLIVPILGAFLGLGIYMGHVNAEESKKSDTLSKADPAWTLNSPNADPTNPANYSPYSGDLSTLCPGTQKICGIVAPNDGTDHPVIEENSDLMQRIQDKDTSASDVFLQN
ncbi:hypothetical protein [Sphingobacterium multivorum]|uniref:hypothetical protein n=1 Tax=Sphingobacterium multivorum TaxID=28454 RepID=UPI0028AC02A1|nr:hypothetical protein [Sphingobacterium multivorum]